MFAWLIYPFVLVFSFLAANYTNSQSVTIIKNDKSQERVYAPPAAELNIKDIKSSYGDFKNLAKNFKENPLAILTKEQVRELILTKLESRFWKNLLTNNPKVLDCISAVLVDPLALPSLMNILANEKKLKIYTYLVIFLQLLVLVVILFFFRFHSPIRRFFYRTAWSLGLQSLAVISFYVLFKKELAPMAAIIATYF